MLIRCNVVHVMHCMMHRASHENKRRGGGPLAGNALPCSSPSLCSLREQCTLIRVSFVPSQLGAHLLLPPITLCSGSFQEIVPLTTTNVLGIEDSEAVSQWDAILRHHLDSAAAAEEASSSLLSPPDAPYSYSGSSSASFSVPDLEVPWNRPDGRKWQTSSMGGSFSAGAGDTESSRDSAADAPADDTTGEGKEGKEAGGEREGGEREGGKGESEGEGEEEEIEFSPHEPSEDLYAVPLTPVEVVKRTPGKRTSSLSPLGNTDSPDSLPTSDYPGGARGQMGAGAEGGGEEDEEGDEVVEEGEEGGGGLVGKAKGGYVKVAGRQMAGVYVTVWVRRSLRRHVHGVKACVVGCGIMGFLGNKASATY